MVERVELRSMSLDRAPSSKRHKHVAERRLTIDKRMSPAEPTMQKKMANQSRWFRSATHCREHQEGERTKDLFPWSEIDGQSVDVAQPPFG